MLSRYISVNIHSREGMEPLPYTGIVPLSRGCSNDGEFRWICVGARTERP